MAWIHSEDNYADDLTTVHGNGALVKLLQKHKIDHSIRQSIIEKPTDQNSKINNLSTENEECNKSEKK